MPENLQIIPQVEIENRIFTVRGVQIMLDSHLAEMYGVETKNLNKAVGRNLDRFPDSFRFQLTDAEIANLRFQIGTSSLHGGSRYLPYAFTEQGVAMLSAVLRSETAVKVSIQIIDAFVEMRKQILGNAGLFQRLDKLESHKIDTDHKFEQIFKALESKDLPPDKGIFFDGQVYDAYTLAADIIKTAKTSIILIDNYIDETVLTLLSKRNANVTANIYTQKISQQLTLDLEKHKQQYPEITVKIITNSHDRFIIIDNQQLYHLGASLKDLGKKWFAFSKMDNLTEQILEKLP
jgi:phage regulator Rha-like protein